MKRTVWETLIVMAAVPLLIATACAGQSPSVGDNTAPVTGATDTVAPKEAVAPTVQLTEPFTATPTEAPATTPTPEPMEQATGTAPLTATPPGMGGGTPSPRISEVQIFLIALEDAGQSGPEIGCGDSIVSVNVKIEATAAPLTAALQQLLAINERMYGQSGLYNALYQSDLSIEQVAVRNGTATIRLSGDLMLGGACDNPRVEAQLKQTALQFSTVDQVDVYVNDQPLGQILSGQ